MNIRTQIVVILVVVFALIALINLVRRDKLQLKYALSWFVLGIGVGVFACLPHLTAFLAGLMGIHTPVNMLFFAGFCFSLAIIFSLSVAVSRLSNRVKKLAQEIALLQDEQQGNREASKEEVE